MRRWGKYLQILYDRLRIEEVLFFLLYLFHHYSPRQFKVSHIKGNYRLLCRLQPGDRVITSRSGELRFLAKRWHFKLRNMLLLGAPQARVERVVYFTLLALTLEFNNPFDRKVLFHFLEKKIALIEKLLARLYTLNGFSWKRAEIEKHLQIYLRNSTLQARIIQRIKRAVSQQGSRPIHERVKEGMIKGLHPVLSIQGYSGAYWMRGPGREVLGLFKPFDEEIHAPHNPVGPIMQGALGQRATRLGCRVGEAAHHEVGAFLVDAFLGFGIVPHTYYAEFTHEVFYLATENRMGGRRARKRKWGSFQEYVAGFDSLDKVLGEETLTFPGDEFQLLVVLDAVIGNTDRNLGNILVGENEIAAIDHGLSFPDWGYNLSSWYWSYFKQGGKPFYPAIIELMRTFPTEELIHKLRSHCFLEEPALAALRERVALFRAGVLAGLTPDVLEKLMVEEYLAPLQGYRDHLERRADENLEKFLQSEASKATHKSPHSL